MEKEGEKDEGGSKSIAFVNVEGEKLKINGGEVRGLLMINRRPKGILIVQKWVGFCVLLDK
ncbi:hypothetical protein [Hoylesella nanceiensis]